MKVSIGVSNRHVHLTKEHLEILFGKDYELKKLKDINQPNQYASTDRVIIETEKGRIENVRILGPTRPYSQVEISKTDSFKLGLNPPVRESGDLENTPGIKIIGPKGELNLNKGVIIASRHIHITPKQIEMYGLKGIKYVDVLLNGEKSSIIKKVFFKVTDEAYFELHIDTDDANANIISNGDIATILGESL